VKKDNGVSKSETTDIASSSSSSSINTGVLTSETTDVDMNIDDEKNKSETDDANEIDEKRIKKRIPPPSSSVLDHMEIFNDGSTASAVIG
jgi:hypothetical protein